MNNQGLKRIIRILLAAAVIFLVVKWCSGSFGNLIPLPGGSGQESSSTTEDSGGGAPDHAERTNQLCAVAAFLLLRSFGRD